MNRVIPMFPDYSMSDKGDIYKQDMKIDISYYRGKLPYIILISKENKVHRKSVEVLRKKVYPEQYEESISDALIFHQEGTLPEKKELKEDQRKLQLRFKYNLSTGDFIDKLNETNISYRNSLGYLAINYENHTQQVHQLVITYMLGEIPINYEIDHVNQIGTDNRWVNLRVVTRKVNSRNLPKA